MLYDIIRHETKTTLTLTPDANPLMSPKNLSASSITATGCTLTWDDVLNATSYRVQKSTDGGVTWVDVSGDPSTETQSITGLTTATSYKFRVASIISGILGDFCAPITVTTS